MVFAREWSCSGLQRPHRNEMIRRLNLDFRKIVSQRVIGRQYDFIKAAQATIELENLSDSLIAQLEAYVAGEVLEKKSFQYHADWKSHCYEALANWAEKRKLFTRIHLWASSKVRLETHTWEVRREWLGEKFEGHPTKVIAYFDNEPIRATYREELF